MAYLPSFYEEVPLNNPAEAGSDLVLTLQNKSSNFNIRYVDFTDASGTASCPDDVEAGEATAVSMQGKGPMTGQMLFDLISSDMKVGSLAINFTNDDEAATLVVLSSGRHKNNVKQITTGEDQESSGINLVSVLGQQVAVKVNLAQSPGVIFIQVHELGRNTRIEGYSHAAQKLMTGRLVFDMHPHVSGDVPVLQWSITPELPNGMTLCPETGVIHGICRQVTPARVYRITAETEVSKARAASSAASGRPASRGDGLEMRFEVTASPESIKQQYEQCLDTIVNRGNSLRRGHGGVRRDKHTFSQAYAQGLKQSVKKCQGVQGGHRDMMIAGLLDAYKTLCDEKKYCLDEGSKYAPVKGLRGPCIVVPEDFTSIQSAVFNAPMHGAHIVVMPGVYCETVIVDRPVIIEGIGAMAPAKLQQRIYQGRGPPKTAPSGMNRCRSATSFAKTRNIDNGFQEPQAYVISPDNNQANSSVFRFVEGCEDAMVRRLAIQGRDKAAVCIEAGAPSLEGCHVTCLGESCLDVTGSFTEPFVTNNRLSTIPTTGPASTVRVRNGACGTYESNTLSQNALGFEVQKGSVPKVSSTKTDKANALAMVLPELEVPEPNMKHSSSMTLFDPRKAEYSRVDPRIKEYAARAAWARHERVIRARMQPHSVFKKPKSGILKKNVAYRAQSVPASAAPSHPSIYI